MKKLLFLILLFFNKNSIAENIYYTNKEKFFIKARAFLIKEEGMKLKAYRDGYFNFKKNYSIGVGMAFYPNLKKVKRWDKITYKKAMSDCLLIIKKIDMQMSNKVFYRNCSDMRKIIIISIVYNLGYSGFENSGLAEIIEKKIEIEQLLKILENFKYNINYNNFTLQTIINIQKKDLHHINNLLYKTMLSKKITKNDIVWSRRMREFTFLI